MFTLPNDQYTRDLNFVKTYAEDAAHYISRVKGLDYQTVLDRLMIEFSEGGRYEVPKRKVKYLEREEHDRKVKTATLADYLKMVTQQRLIMVPTFTAYIPKTHKVSIIAEFISRNIKLRKHVKGKMFECEKVGDKEGYVYNDILQTTYKQKSNSLSGTYTVPSTPLYNATGHSTLTSTTCGCATTANACNERFVRGNRHYYNRTITLNNIASIVNHTDYAVLKAAMTQYQLHYPTPEQAIALVRYSTDLYWPNPEHFGPVAEYLTALTPLERAAFCYTGDFYHLREFNPGFMRQFLSTLITKDTTPVADPVGAITSLTGAQRDMLGLFCANILNAEPIDKLIRENDPRLATVGAIAAHTVAALEHYRLLFRAFMVTPNVPGAICDFPASNRRCVVLSDTDSTLFTLQNWVAWYSGEINFTEASNDISALMVYLSSQQIKHYLGVLSGNLGIHPDDIFGISLKNELMYPAFVLSGRAKHDFAFISAREGNVYPTPKIEQKGVGYKESNVPGAIMRGVDDLIHHILQTVTDGNPIDLRQILRGVGDLERQVYASVQSGSTEFFPRMTIRNKESYAEKEDEAAYDDIEEDEDDEEGSGSKAKLNGYSYHELWEAVFAPKYGSAGKPEYKAIKVSLTTSAKTRLAAWVESIPDATTQAALRAWLTENGRALLTTIYLPEHVVSITGIPSEIIPVIDNRKQVYSIVRAYYLVLESLGYHINVGSSMKYMISDEH